MIDIRIPKEIRSYEAKFVGPLTMRQTICVAVGLIVCVFVYNICKSFIPRDLMLFILIFPAAAIFCFGWVKPYGMKFEQFFFSAVRNNFIAPRRRKYKTVNTHAEMLKAIHMAEKLQQKQENKQNKVKPPKPKKRKYKKSKEAIK